MNEPEILEIHGIDYVSIESIARYIDTDSQCLMPIVVEETKREYGIRLLQVLAQEIRDIRKSQEAMACRRKAAGWEG